MKKDLQFKTMSVILTTWITYFINYAFIFLHHLVLNNTIKMRYLRHYITLNKHGCSVLHTNAAK